MSLKRWTGTEWVVVAGSRPGPAGATGATGPSGTIAIGTTTTVGTGGNATVSNSGTSTAAVLNFGLVRGATGETGSAGVAGTRGSKTYTAQTTPQNAGLTGILDGDNFVNLNNGNYYVYSGGNTNSWVLQGNITGPAGLTGEAGATGATGATGAVGPIGDVVVADIVRRVSAFEVDQILNLGIFYPKYLSNLTLAQLNGKILASAYIF